MRQVGVLAAAGLVALEKSPALLHQDHANAKFLAEGLARIPGIRLDASRVKTNILVFDVSGTGMSSAEISEGLAARRVLASGVTPATMRMVTHYDVDRAGCAQALEAMEQVVRRRA